LGFTKGRLKARSFANQQIEGININNLDRIAVCIYFVPQNANNKTHKTFKEIFFS